MRTGLPHNVIVAISVNCGAVLYTSCELCRASSLSRCSLVIFHFNEIAFLQRQKNIVFFYVSITWINLLNLLCIEIMVFPVHRISTIVLQQNYFVANIFVTQGAVQFIFNKKGK